MEYFCWKKNQKEIPVFGKTSLNVNMWLCDAADSKCPMPGESTKVFQASEKEKRAGNIWSSGWMLLKRLSSTLGKADLLGPIIVPENLTGPADTSLIHKQDPRLTGFSVKTNSPVFTFWLKLGNMHGRCKDTLMSSPSICKELRIYLNDAIKSKAWFIVVNMPWYCLGTPYKLRKSDSMDFQCKISETFCKLSCSVPHPLLLIKH